MNILHCGYCTTVPFLQYMFAWSGTMLCNRVWTYESIWNWDALIVSRSFVAFSPKWRKVLMFDCFEVVCAFMQMQTAAHSILVCQSTTKHALLPENKCYLGGTRSEYTDACLGSIKRLRWLLHLLSMLHPSCKGILSRSPLSLSHVQHCSTHTQGRCSRSFYFYNLARFQASDRIGIYQIEILSTDFQLNMIDFSM